MLKTFAKLLLSTIVYAIVYILANVVMPYSQGLKELGTSDDHKGMFYLLIIAAFVCFTIYFIIRHSHLNGKKLFLNIVFVLFFVQLFMAQIETLYFGYAFPALTTLDVVLIMVAGLIPLLVTVPLMIKFFQNKEVMTERVKMNIKSLSIKLGIIGIIYTCVYMTFGYFVAWQFEELRVFYSGSSEKLSFWAQIFNNDPKLYLFQILRGILFGAFVIPLKNMIRTKMAFMTSVCLVYVYLGIVLILPTRLFPDMVRMGHLLEVTSSMLLFGIIVGNILWENKHKKQVEAS
ncbi:MAG: hypothetical protein FWC50_05165 [Planctomycetaceae bacterium]|nr:hypothetical protein [Planctomycetaceae bacterium]